MKKSISYSLMAAVLLTASGLFTSCEKVSPTGVLIGNTSVDDRVKQSLVNFSSFEVAWDKDLADTIQEYSFLVGSDSHITEDPGRLEEMIEIGMEHDDLFYCHLGDLADTKTEYYNNTEMVIQRETEKWMDKYLVPVYKEDGDVYTDTTLFTDPRTGDIYLKNKFNIFPTNLPFYPVVGNHDITHNGWALYSRIFKTSFYEFTVRVINDNDTVYDRFIFLDSANGTLGNYQIDEIENGIFQRDKKKIRHVFTFTHTNIFRPSLNEFASTYCREELYYILDKLADWQTTIAFWGHVHAWDERNFGNVHHITMPSMNFVDHPNGGDDLLVRVTVKKDGDYKIERVGLHCKQRTKQELQALGYHTTTK